MQELLQRMSEAMTGNFLLGIVFAFLAGIISIFSPCSLSNIPLIVSYVGGFSDGRKKALIYSVFICLGMTVTFVILGIIAALAGKLMGIGGLDNVWHIFLALLMVFMALELWGLTNFLEKLKGSNLMSKVKKKGSLGAFLIGVTGGLFCLPCTTPILAAMLAFVSASGAGIIQGGLLLLIYSIGHSVPLVVLGTSVGAINQITNSSKFNNVSKIIRGIFGALVFALAIYFIIITFYI